MLAGGGAEALDTDIQFVVQILKLFLLFLLFLRLPRTLLLRWHGVMSSHPISQTLFTPLLPSAVLCFSDPPHLKMGYTREITRGLCVRLVRYCDRLQKHGTPGGGGGGDVDLLSIM